MTALDLKFNKDKTTFKYQGYNPTCTLATNYCYKPENNHQYSSDKEIEIYFIFFCKNKIILNLIF